MEQIQVSREVLLGALAALADIVNPKPIETYGHVLFECTGGEMTARATDGAVAAKVRVCELAGDSFPLSLPHRELSAFVRALPPGLLTMSEKAGFGVVSNGRSSMRIGGLPAGDFPLWTPPAGDVLCTVAADQARDAISRANACAVDVDTSYIRSGAVIEFAPEALSIQATDGSRLFASGQRFPDATSALLPKRGLSALCKALGPVGDGPVRVRLGENWCWWEADGLCFSMLRLSGSSPNMRRVLDARKRGPSVDVRADDLRRAMSRISIMARATHKAVLLEARGGDTLALSIASPEGSIEETLPADFHGVNNLPRGIRLSAGFIAAAPEIIAGETLRLSAQTTEMDPVTFTCPDAAVSDEYVVMPMRA